MPDDLWEAGKVFLAGFRRHFWYLLPSIFVAPFELYERIIRPNFLPETAPEHLIVPAVAFPWVLLVTVLWTAFLTFRDLYLEKQQLLKKKQAPGLSVSSNHVPVTASAPAPNASKIFINATPDYLMDLVEGKLSTEAERMIEPYIGKWMTVTDRISDVSIRNTGSIVTERNDRYRQLDLWFNSAWNERLNVLYKGQEIRVNGKIDRIWPTRIFLIDCELTN